MDNEVEVLGTTVSTEEKERKNWAIEQNKIKLFWNKGFTGKGINCW